MAEEPKKKMSKLAKYSIIGAIAILLLVGTIAGVKALKKRKDRKILEQEKADGGNHSNNGHSPSSNGSPYAPPPSNTPTATKNLKLNDKIWATEMTNLYNVPAMGAAAHVLTAKPGEYVGQVKSLSPLKVELHSYKGDDVGTTFYIPLKNFIVRNS
jgi:hypothetical protein